ncbi:MAG: hypothetical protein AB1796_10520 [Bacillota bacterium]
MSDKRLTEKRKQFSRAAKHNPYKKWVMLAMAVLAITLFAFKVTRPPETGASAFAFGEPVVEPRSYVGKLISMTEVEPLIENEMIKIPLAAVDGNDIVSFTVENDEGFAVPLMAYITPSGRLFAGSSMCEPCRGRTPWPARHWSVIPAAPPIRLKTINLSPAHRFAARTHPSIWNRCWKTAR